MKYPVVVLGTGPIPCDLMIVGEAPGRAEIKLKQPFVGRSGELLSDALRGAGSSYEQCYITNVFKGDVGDGNRNPTEDELDDHFVILHRELIDVAPKSMLLLGGFATKEFLGNSYMKDKVGQSFNFEYNFNKVLLWPCYHPAYILRNRRPEIVFSFYDIVSNFVNSSVNSGT